MKNNRDDSPGVDPALNRELTIIQNNIATCETNIKKVKAQLKYIIELNNNHSNNYNVNNKVYCIIHKIANVDKQPPVLFVSFNMTYTDNVDQYIPDKIINLISSKSNNLNKDASRLDKCDDIYNEYNSLIHYNYITQVFNKTNMSLLSHTYVKSKFNNPGTIRVTSLI